MRDFAPVTMVAYSPHILVVQSRRSGQLGAGAGGAREEPSPASSISRSPASAARRIWPAWNFALRTGVKWEYIPYKGGSQAIADVAGGQADVTLNGMLATYPLVKGGKLKLLAVSSARRMSAIPDVPTIAESGLPGFETGSWQGVVAPAGTPRDVVARLNAEIGRILARARDARQARQPGCGGAHQLAGRVCRFHPHRKSPLGEGGEGSRRQGGVGSRDGRWKHGAFDFFRREPMAALSALSGVEGDVRDAPTCDTGCRENCRLVQTPPDQPFVAYVVL